MNKQLDTQKPTKAPPAPGNAARDALVAFRESLASVGDTLPSSEEAFRAGYESGAGEAAYWKQAAETRRAMYTDLYSRHQAERLAAQGADEVGRRYRVATEPTGQVMTADVLDAIERDLETTHTEQQRAGVIRRLVASHRALEAELADTKWQLKTADRDYELSEAMRERYREALTVIESETTCDLAGDLAHTALAALPEE